MIEFHEIANIFPLIEGKDFDALVEDIKKQGLREEIWLYKGKIIDGRNRYRACLKAGVQPKFRTWDEVGSLTDFVVSYNLMRRQLSIEQRTAAALKAKPFYDAEAKERMQATQFKGGKTPTATQKVAQPDGESADIVAKKFDTNKVYLRELERLQEVEPEKFEEIATGKMKMAAHLKERKIEVRKEKIAAQVEEIKKLVKPTGKFNVIVIDPPWPMEDLDNYDPEFRRGVTPYPTMTMEEIRNIKLPCEDDCVVWVWGIEKFIKETLEIIDAWGLKKKNTLIWNKVTFGLAGKYLRPQHEYCFLCIKGNPKIYGEGTGTVLSVQKKSHSEKPDEFYALVEKICPYPTRLDYFARKKREGWQTFGNGV